MVEKLQMRLFGDVEVLRGAEPVAEVLPAKALALLCYLAVTRRPHPRTALAGLLWGDRPEAQALTSLRQALVQLRRVLSPYLHITRQTVAFNFEAPYWLDVEAFEKKIEQPKPSPQVLKEAVELYRGDFLERLYVREAWTFEEWALLQRERLRTLALQALHRLVALYTAEGAYPSALHYIDRLLTLAPWQEEAHRQKMLLLARSGQHSAALAQYETCRRALAEELGVEPSAETTALYERIRAARSTRRLNLPPQPTPFIGRQHELQELGHLLANPDCRLLTLIGPGGIGKTRLALQVAAQHRERFLHGVGFVPLASVQSPAFLPQAIAKALGFAFHGPDDLQTQLLNHLQEREMLLVLDNFEHLLDGAELLVKILQNAPAVKLLVTSREALRLRWEWLFRVHGMAIPAPNQNARIEDYDALQLFVNLARRLDPHFPVEAEREAIISICRLVEGMPLGIELAAAWVREYTCTTIAQRLERNLAFLTSPLRDSQPRHRSLLAAFNHSWKLLSVEERIAFRRLAVFQGGFRPEAAQWIAEVPTALIQALESKSLLRREASGRYAMHKLLQQYALEKLREAPDEEERIRERHSSYYTDFLHKMEAFVDGKRQQETLRAIEEESENIWAGWMWAVEHGNVKAIEKAMEALYRFYEIRGWFREGAKLFASTAERLRQQSHRPDEIEATIARLQARQGVLALHYGDYAQAQAQLEASLSTFRRSSNQREIAFILNNLGILASFRGAYEEEQHLFQESLALYRALGEHARVATVLNNLGIYYRIVGSYDKAQHLTEESLALCRLLGYRRGMARAIQSLGIIAHCRGDYTQAKQYHLESLAIFREIDDQWGIALNLGNLGGTAYQLGEYAEAKRYHLESLALRKEIGDQWGIIISHNNLGSTALAMGKIREAEQHLHQALELAMKINAQPLALDALVELALILKQRGKEDRALELATLIAHHPATEDHTRARAKEFVAHLSARLSPSAAAAAQERGTKRKIEEVVEEMMKGIQS